MQKLSIEELLKATDGKLLKGDIFYEINDVVIDSRNANKDNVFVAIIGKNLDGHKFLDSAYKNGCKTFIKNESSSINISYEDINLIEVKNTELALGDISKYYKNKFDIPYVAVTGSVGKTTTRDFIHSVLSYKFKTLKNEGNLNNNFGVPLTLFNLDDTYECSVIEMGMSGFNEIEYLANIVNPNISVISNIGLSHIENLGSQEGIFEAKMEITKNFNKDNVLIVNGDDKFLSTLKEKSLDYKLKTFGFGKDNDIYCKDYEILNNSTEFICVIDNKEEKIEIPTVGKHNIYNAMASILVGLSLKMSLEEIKEGLLKFVPTKMRLDIINSNNKTIINDCYNASPESMEAALSILSKYENRKVAILGDMFEMGDYTEYGHRKVGKNILNNTDILITIGNSSKFISEEAIKNGFTKENCYHFQTKEEGIKNFSKILKDDDVVLVKASRGMQFEKLIEYI